MGTSNHSIQTGRGADSNTSGRYEATTNVAFDDGWPDKDEEGPFVLRTTVHSDTSKTIIAHNTSPDVSFDHSINPYRGCEHGCIYCFARPTHAWLGLSPGLDFETELFAKHDAASLLRQALANPRYKPALIAIGTNTDPYQPIERRLRIMRGILEVLAEANHPVSITTKSDAVLRDIDILTEMAKTKTVHVTISVTTLDRRIARSLEPRAAAPHRRLAAIEKLSAAGIPTAVNVAPIIPGLTDHELEAILEMAADRGAAFARYIALRLPLEVKELFEEWLLAHHPDRAAKVLSLVRGMRGGKLNSATFGERMKGEGPYALMIETRFKLATARFGLDRRNEEEWLETNHFRRPSQNPNQLALDF
ncbi:MAG: PA0069 family radical SAM protein [Alphaproteobacteria bacterium]